MALTPRAHERDAIVALLESDHESADALAGAVIKKAFELIQRRHLFTALVGDEQGVGVYGPFATPADAERAARSADFGPSSVRVGRMWAPELLSLPVLVVAGMCGACGHPKATHEHQRGQGRCWALTARKNARGCACDQYVQKERMGV